MFQLTQDSPGCPSIRAGSPLVLVGPRKGVKIENGLWVTPPFSFLPRGSTYSYVCVDTPACMFKLSPPAVPWVLWA